MAIKSGGKKSTKAGKASARKASALAMPGRHIVRVPSSPYRVQFTARTLANAMERVFRARGSHELLTVKTAFALTPKELGGLFGVSRQAVDKWMDSGVPTRHVAEVDRVAEIARDLKRRFKAQRLPAIVRGPMAILDSRSIYDVLRDEGVEPIHELFRRWEALIPGAEPIRAGQYVRRKDALVAAR